MLEENDLQGLRQLINESLRVQANGVEPIPYVDVSNALTDITSRHNHVVFGRRGCGKTLLLRESTRKLPEGIRVVYINCEDFKRHSFPDVLIEILKTVRRELGKGVPSALNPISWFGQQKQARESLDAVSKTLSNLERMPDQRSEKIRELEATSEGSSTEARLSGNGLSIGRESTEGSRESIERRYQENIDKGDELQGALPDLKRELKLLVERGLNSDAVFLQLDDFYHLRRSDQPFVADYLHRICKDTPYYFKLATLRHSSSLFLEHKDQPIGVQQRHDYQPIDVDFNLKEFDQTVDRIQKIFYEFASRVDISQSDFDSLFMGAGFKRLVLAGGGVPRDCMSLFLDALDEISKGDRIGKDLVRNLSRKNLNQRIEDLKKDSKEEDQDALVRGAYSVRQFALDRGRNIFMVNDDIMKKREQIRELLLRLVDYRIIHSVGEAYNHKHKDGTFHGFMVDIGCYAHMRVLAGKFKEISLDSPQAKERIRASPVLNPKQLQDLWNKAPEDAESQLVNPENA